MVFPCRRHRPVATRFMNTDTSLLVVIGALLYFNILMTTAVVFDLFGNTGKPYSKRDLSDMDHRQKVSPDIIESTIDTHLEKITIFCNASSFWQNCTQVDFTSSLLIGNGSMEQWNQEVVSIAIGIVLEPKTRLDHLNSTLSSIVENSDVKEREGVVVVMHLSELLGRSSRNKILSWLNREHTEHLRSGFIRVIQSPETELRHLRFAKVHFNGNFDAQLDNSDRRRFQAVDTAFLLLYCNRVLPTRYFMQFSDDVICERNFLKGIRDFVGERKRNPWLTLQFSTIGVTGKLFRQSVLQDIAQFLMFFSPTLSVDMMYQFYLDLRLQNHNYLRVPSIFRRIGNRTLHQDESRVSRPPNKPKGAQVYSSMVPHNKLIPQKAYEAAHKAEYFEGKDPRRGDEIVVVFPAPTSISRVLVKTGHHGLRDPHGTIRDILLDGKLEFSARLTEEKSERGVPRCESYRTIGYSIMGEIDIRNIDHEYGGNVTCLRITVLQDQVQWLAVNPIILSV